jgi:hypothetical protein
VSSHHDEVAAFVSCNVRDHLRRPTRLGARGFDADAARRQQAHTLCQPALGVLAREVVESK